MICILFILFLLLGVACGDTTCYGSKCYGDYYPYFDNPVDCDLEYNHCSYVTFPKCLPGSRSDPIYCGTYEFCSHDGRTGEPMCASWIYYVGMAVGGVILLGIILFCCRCCCRRRRTTIITRAVPHATVVQNVNVVQPVPPANVNVSINPTSYQNPPHGYQYYPSGQRAPQPGFQPQPQPGFQYQPQPGFQHQPQPGFQHQPQPGFQPQPQSQKYPAGPPNYNDIAGKPPAGATNNYGSNPYFKE